MLDGLVKREARGFTSIENLEQLSWWNLSMASYHAKKEDVMYLDPNLDNVEYDIYFA